MLQQSSEQIVPSGAKAAAGTVNESKDIRQIGSSDTICLYGKGAAGALASGSFDHGLSTHGVSRCSAQFVSDTGHVLQSGQSELRRVRDFTVDQKGECFAEAPGSAAVSCLGFRFFVFVRKAGSLRTGARGSGAQLERMATPTSGEDCASP